MNWKWLESKSNVVIRQTVAEKLTAYLRHTITLEELVDWAEQVMQEGDFDEADDETLRDVVSRLGVADVRAFGLTWGDCEQFLQRLGYIVRVGVVVRSGVCVASSVRTVGAVPAG